MDSLKYEYLLKTWGGFYNSEYKDIHGEVEGYHYFETAEKRAEYLAKLRWIEKDFHAVRLVVEQSEGYNTRTIVTLNRVIKWKGKEYYSNRELSPNYPYGAAKHFLEYKWRPGFNDYPLGEDFDYEQKEVEIVQEWITGAFDITYK
ncbi:hypothetical protein [Flagellimonas marina]|uniref:Uncharacterized protein n=1 Tax=Flagellimonas marina TaxID=1775168 RepID=A0ABV8PJE8_9FLAO